MNGTPPPAPGRRTAFGLVIEGTAHVVSRRGPASSDTAPSPAIAMIRPFARRRRPYQSLLDDAMRLADECRPFQAARSPG